MEDMGITTDKKQGFSLYWLYFSPEGRLTRRPFWLFSLVEFILYLLLFSPSGPFIKTDSPAISWIIFIIGIVQFIGSICVGIKRSHDRGRSGWFALLWFVPILCVWPIIELGFLRGTIGDNKYGKDKLLLPQKLPPSKDCSVYCAQAEQEISSDHIDKGV